MTEIDSMPRWGVSHTLALAMSALDLDVVHRSTLRALLPEGSRPPKRLRGGLRAGVSRVNGLDARSRRLIELGQVSNPENLATTTKPKNKISDAFQKALARFDQDGWISRGTMFILIRDRRALLDWATSSTPPEGKSLDLARAVQQINDDLAEGNLSDKAVEQRRRELLAIQRLMEQGFGSRNWSGRGSVRFVPRGSTL